MNWIVLSLASSFSFAVVSAMDKILLQRYMPTPRVFIVLVGLCQFGLAAVAAPFAELGGHGAWHAFLSFCAGMLSGLYLALMFWVMSKQDVSRVVPVTSTHTIFVALLAMFFLGEVITPLAWFGIVMTMVGAALMSLGPTMRESERDQNQIIPFVVLLVASFAFGLSNYVVKLVADDIDIWSQFMWRAIGMGVACGFFLFRPRMMPELIDTIRSPMAMGALIFTEGALVLGAVYLTLAAIYAGPVSLVVAVMASRPLFVFILGIALSLGISRVLDEPLEGKILVAKIAAIALTVGGVVAVSIN